MDCQNSSQTITEAVAQKVEAHNRLDMALNALDAVRDLCVGTASLQPTTALDMVNADNFACLLGMIVDEMRTTQKLRVDAEDRML